MKLFKQLIEHEIYVLKNAKYMRRFMGAKLCEDVYGRQNMKDFLADYAFTNGDLQWSDKNIRESCK